MSTDAWIAKYNETLAEIGCPVEGLKIIQVVRNPEFNDTESIEVAVTYRDGLVRHFQIEAFDKLRRFLSAQPFRIYSIGLPLILVDSVTPESISKAVRTYLAQEEGWAECGRNAEVYQLYGIRITPKPGT